MCQLTVDHGCLLTHDPKISILTLWKAIGNLKGEGGGGGLKSQNFKGKYDAKLEVLEGVGSSS